MFRMGRVTLAVVAVLLAFPAVSLAATYTVNTTADNPPNPTECSGAPGDCSLRQALDKATSGDTVSVPANATAYQVNGTPISIPAGVTIVGGGASATTVTGGGNNQIFIVDNTSGSVSISAITLTKGYNNSGSDEAGALWITDGDVSLDQVAITDSSSPRYGGAIEDDGGNLTITRSRFTGDTAGTQGGGAIDYYASGNLSVSDTEFANDSSNSYAGAVFVESEPTAVTFNRVTFDGNSVASGGSVGGAMEIEAGSKLTTPAALRNVTFTRNSAPSDGGGLDVSATGSVAAVNDTFASNSAPQAADVYNEGGSFSTQNSIYATPQGGGSSCSGTITDSGNNLEDAASSSCGFSSANGDIVGQSAQLASAPADNGSAVATAGGPPQTLALSSTSPALHAASASGCSTVGSVDERDLPRPGESGTACDIGAFELQYHTLTVTLSGSGTVAGGGISCPGTCSKTYPEGTQVTLTATPASGYTFAGWGGACSGSGGCTVTISPTANASVTATFSPVLTVSISGKGTVTGGGISCPSVCSKSYPKGTKVTLTAKAASGYRFSGWSGACSGKGNCTVTMNGPESVKATFVKRRLSLAVSPASGTAGVRACFHFTVTRGGKAVEGATVHFAGRTARTSAHGRATICATLGAGTYQARATKRGLRAAVKAVRIKRPPTPPKFTG